MKKISVVFLLFFVMLIERAALATGEVITGRPRYILIANIYQTTKHQRDKLSNLYNATY